jgi:hypothetical protein
MKGNMMKGNMMRYTPMVKVAVQLESGSSWGDLVSQSMPITEELKLYSGFEFVAGWVNKDTSTIGWQCNLKPNASLAMTEHFVYITLAKYSIGVDRD